MASASAQSKTQTKPRTPSPYREIRAHNNDSTITLYSAYNHSIASAALSSNRLSASPAFLMSRMTWFKPSWNWMMYRAHYSYKDSNQAHILGLELPRARFRDLLMGAVVCHSHGGKLTEKEKGAEVRVQWDPERDVRVQVLGDGHVRSLQIGVKGETMRKVVEEWGGKLVDYTEMAKGMKKVVDEEKDVTWEEMVERGLVPEERVYEVDEELRQALQMDVKG